VAYTHDFKAIKAAVTIQQVLDMLEIRHLTPHGEGLRGQCPICQVTNPRGFVVTPAKGAWYCFSEKKGGDIIELVAKHGRISQKEAAGRIASHFKLNGAGQSADNARPQPEAVADGRKPDGFDPRAYQQSLDPAHEALTGLGVSPDTLQLFGGGYAPKGLHRGRLALPICRCEGTILGFVGIALKGETPELLYPKGFVVPFFLGTQLVKEGTLYLVQHPLDALHAVDNGVENVIALLVPLCPDALTSLQALMVGKNCHTLELY
jgi:CHC2 zinc finger